MKYKILFCMFLTILVLASFVSAEIILGIPVFIGTPIIPLMHVGESHIFKVQVYHPYGAPIVITWYLDGELASSNEYDSTSPPLGITDEYNFIATSEGTYNFKVVASNLPTFCPPDLICNPFSNSIEFDVYVAPNIIIILIEITPPIISNVQTNWIDKNTVNITWDTDEPSYFNTIEYGRGRKYKYDISKQYNTNLTSNMIPQPSISLILDKPNTYHYRVGSCDLFGNCAYSKDYKIKKEI